MSMLSSDALRSQLDEREDLQHLLFCKGFLITDAANPINTDGYPFYGNWDAHSLGGTYTAYVHKEQRITIVNVDQTTLFLIGHAYDPYMLEASEEAILTRIVSSQDRIACINNLTGVFFLGILADDELQLHVDASSMQWVCYGRIGGHLYVTSHKRLVGDLLGLKMANYAHRLVNYRWYHYMMGNYLPGDITCFDELTRIVPNTYVTYRQGSFEVTRFYPTRPIAMCADEDEYWEVVAEAAAVLKNTMALIPQKWDRPAISLTGGIDSNTTFAAANGVYDEYSTFSYVSMYRESVDAEKARQISERFGVPWRLYEVPDSNDDVPDFELYRAIQEWNGGGIGSNGDSDIRKKVTLITNDVCDVEVKSWISETVRAYAYKYFGRASFPADFSARNYTSLYKIFAADRRLVRETDDCFRRYWEHTRLKEHLFNYDESDLFVWEMMHGYKCGLNIGVMKACFDITIPYNNRRLLDTLLRVPLKKRLSDQLHLDLKRVMNEELYDMGIRVVNLNETDKRKRLANMYFTINSALPF